MPRQFSPTMRDGLDQFLESRVHLAPSTIANDRSVLRRFIDGVGADRRMATVRPDQAETWFRSQLVTQNAASRNKIRQRVEGFLDFATRRAWIDRDLLRDVPRRRAPRRERFRLDAQQLVRLPYTTDDPRDRAFLTLATNTGLRAGEITAIRLRQVDLDTGYIHIERTKTGSTDEIPVTNMLSTELLI